MLGCDQEPSQYALLSSVAKEIRRRIGWQIYYLDLLVAVAAGLPPLKDTKSWGLCPLGELRDELIGTSTGIAYENAVHRGEQEPDHAGLEGSLVSAPAIFASAKYHQSVVTQSILERMYGRSPLTGKVLSDILNDLETLRFALSSSIRRLPQYDVVDALNSDAVFAQWASLLLSALIDRNWTYLYYPLSHATDKRKWQETLDRILNHSRSYLERITALTCFDEFAPLQWAWPGIHQPLQAIMVLLHHIKQQPNSQHTEANISAIDEALSLCDREGGMIGGRDGPLNRRPLKEGGQEAWYLIWNLRTQAWQRAGYNPEQLLTRAETVERVRRRFANLGFATSITEADGFQLPDHFDSMFDDELRTGSDPFMSLDPNIDWLQWN
ncbi:MAG: hypothetical protein Q9157_005690 [Trypethelium eluteriae]